MDSSPASCSLARKDFFGAETLLQKLLIPNFESTQIQTQTNTHTHTQQNVYQYK